MPACHFGPIFGTKRWITFEWKKISKIANTVLEKRQRRGSVPNFKTSALAVWKLKGKENCENEHRETASFMYNFVQKTNATVPLWWHFIPPSPLIFFSHGFHQKIRFKRNFKKRPKSDFRAYFCDGLNSISFCQKWKDDIAKKELPVLNNSRQRWCWKINLGS